MLVNVSVSITAITASTFNASQEVTVEQLTLPQQEDVVNLSSAVQPAQVQIPPDFLLERLQAEGNQCEMSTQPIFSYYQFFLFSAIPVVFIWFQNLQNFLPSSVKNLSNNTRGASSVVSIQVGRTRVATASAVLLNSPVQLNFSFENVSSLHLK